MRHITEKQKEKRRKDAREYYYNKLAKEGKKIRKVLTEEEKEERRRAYARDYYSKNREKILRKKKEKMPFVKKTKVEKVKEVKPRMKSNTNQYVLDSQLTYQIILSKGKGTPTNKLQMMLYKMCEGVNQRFSYNDEDMKYDVTMDSYLNILIHYDKFDNEKYSRSFPYVTEIIKRSQAKSFNRERHKGISKPEDGLTYHSMDI